MPKDFIVDRSEDYLFSRNNYRRMIWLSLFLSILCSCLVAYIIFQHLNAPKSPYIATTSDGEIFPIFADN